MPAGCKGEGEGRADADLQHKEVPRLRFPRTVMTGLHTVPPLDFRRSQLPSYKPLHFHFTGGAGGRWLS